MPENRSEPDGRTLGLNVVVLPALVGPAREDAVTYLAGGPGDAATETALAGGWQSSALRTTRDFLLVDQRGTGRSEPPHNAEVTQYGTRIAMDDLDAVRAALGYRQLDVFGGSYGATAAQVYAKLHPSSVRTLILSGASAIDVPFFGRYAGNAQRALDQLAQFCASQAPCRKAFPRWETQPMTTRGRPVPVMSTLIVPVMAKSVKAPSGGEGMRGRKAGPGPEGWWEGGPVVAPPSEIVSPGEAKKATGKTTGGTGVPPNGT